VTTYRIQIRGELDARFAPGFAGWSVARDSGSTVMTGEVADPAGLQRILDRFEDLGLEVIRVRALESANGQPGTPEGAFRNGSR
jgi:hypothetical protein